MRLNWTRISMACAGMCLGATVHAQVKVETIAFKGWLGCSRVSNRTVELIFVPQIGRAMKYARLGGPNVLWENEALLGKVRADVPAEVNWANFGGDKLWNAPQARWNWPPDLEIDAGQCTVTPVKNGIRIVGTASKRYGLRFSREITLEESGTEVRFLNRMENVGAETVLWSVWQVTQLADPEFAGMPAHTSVETPKGYRSITEPEKGRLTRTGGDFVLKRSTTAACKIGTDSPKGVLWAKAGEEMFEMKSTLGQGTGLPEGHSWMELYTNPDPLKYMELEAVGPIVPVSPGNSTSTVVIWRLRDRR